MIAEIEDLQRENQSLIQELHIAQENAKVARRDQVIGEERLRRQNERLEEARKVSDIAVKEQSQVMLKLNELQKWTDCIDDGEAVEVMHRLFQRLEDWIKRHFNQASKASHPIGNTGGKEALSGHWNKSWPAIQAIQAAISEQLCHGIFCRYMVGFPDRSYESTFHSVDKEIQRSCQLSYSSGYIYRPNMNFSFFFFS